MLVLSYNRYTHQTNLIYNFCLWIMTICLYYFVYSMWVNFESLWILTLLPSWVMWLLSVFMFVNLKFRLRLNMNQIKVIKWIFYLVLLLYCHFWWFHFNWVYGWNCDRIYCYGLMISTQNLIARSAQYKFYIEDDVITFKNSIKHDIFRYFIENSTLIVKLNTISLSKIQTDCRFE